MLQGKTFQRKMLHEILQLKLTYLLTNMQCTTHTKKAKKSGIISWFVSFVSKKMDD